MPKTHTPTGNYAQTLAYRALSASVLPARRKEREQKEAAIAKAQANPIPWEPRESNRQFERRMQLSRIAARKRLPPQEQPET